MQGIKIYVYHTLVQPVHLCLIHMLVESAPFYPTILFALSQSSNNFNLISTRQKPKDADSSRNMFEG